MNLKVILIIALIVVLLLGMISFGYMTYGIYNQATPLAGVKVVEGHQLFFYVQLAVYLVSIGVGAGLFIMR